ncbi:MAG: hypothetical protein R6W85_12045 [Gillisia sp.]
MSIASYTLNPAQQHVNERGSKILDCDLLDLKIHTGVKGPVRQRSGS